MLVRNIGILSLFFLTLAWTYIAGKDLNWDLLNYHYYGPYLFLENRWSSDFFAASIQSYLNPIGYLPFYLMVRYEINDLIISLILSTFHFLNIFLAYKIGIAIVKPEPKEGQNASLVGAGLAFLSPIFLTVVGTSFLDPLTSIGVLIALLICLYPKVESFRFGLAAFVFGMACGFKLTNLIFLPAFFLTFILALNFNGCFKRVRWLSLVLIVAMSFIGGMAATHGYWSLKLFQNFGNPFFPLLNSIFNSPFYFLEELQDQRFLGTGSSGVLTLPFAMTRSEGWIYSEAPAPDLRTAAFTVLFIAFGIYYLIDKARNSQLNLKESGFLWFKDSQNKSFFIVTVFFVISFITWGLFSRIGRYGLPLWIVIAPILAATLSRVKFPLARHVFITVVIALQLVVIVMSGVSHWTPAEWEKVWFRFEVPTKLKADPAAILSVGNLPFAAIAPFIHPESSFINITGQFTLPAHDPFLKEIEKRLEGKKSKYVMFKADAEANQLPSQALRQSVDAKLAIHGLYVMNEECLKVQLHYTPKHSLFESSDKKELHPSILFCPIEKGISKFQSQILTKLNFYDRFFDKVEDACPDRFRPHRPQSVASGNVVGRSYFNTGTGLYIEDGVVRATGFRSLFAYPIGTTSGMEAGEVPTCPPKIVNRYLN